jgi:hypothetical protein
LEGTTFLPSSLFFKKNCLQGILENLVFFNAALTFRIELMSADGCRRIVHIDEKFCNETAQQVLRTAFNFYPRGKI